MTTESDAVLDTIVDNWGGGGYGGATPKIQSTTDIAVDRWAALDAVIVLHDTLDELHPPVNDIYVNKQYTMDIRVTSIVSEDQLKLLVEETEYLLNNTAITGFTSVRVTRKNRASSDRGRKVYRNDITILLKALLSASAVAPSGGTLDWNLSEALMLGSTNAAWVPLIYVGHNQETNRSRWGTQAQILNLGGFDFSLVFQLHLPTLKGSLNLYIGDIRGALYDADVSDYIDKITIWGGSDGSAFNTNIDNDPTNQTGTGSFTWSRTPNDVSSYRQITVIVDVWSSVALEFELNNMQIECYYDT